MDTVAWMIIVMGTALLAFAFGFYRALLRVPEFLAKLTPDELNVLADKVTEVRRERME